MANTYESPEGRNSASLIVFVPSIQCDAFPQEPGRMRDSLLFIFNISWVPILSVEL